MLKILVTLAEFVQTHHFKIENCAKIPSGLPLNAYEKDSSKDGPKMAQISPRTAPRITRHRESWLAISGCFWSHAALLRLSLHTLGAPRASFLAPFGALRAY